jgi:isoprenylcysteine carboxyl methyltransferase (ICMT) family protein YpbQ
VAVVLSVSHCSLTLQRDDASIANAIASGLFGDGAAAVVLAGAGRALPGPRVLGTRSVLYPDTEWVMGWDVVDTGFRVVLSGKVPEVVREHVGADVDAFLASHGLARRDVRHWIAHTGGPKVLDALPRRSTSAEALSRSRRSLAELGTSQRLGPLRPRRPARRRGGARETGRSPPWALASAPSWCCYAGDRVRPLALYLALVALVALERIAELLLSERNRKAVLARGGVEHGGGHYPAMVALHAALLVGCAAEALAFPAPPPAAALLAAGGVLGAQALRWWAVAALGGRWSTRVLVPPGEAPVTRGPYRFLRHPNYLAVIVEVACLPLAWGSWRTATVFSAANAALLAVRIRAEERALGPAWAEAFGGLPRLVPRGRGARR